MEILPTGLPDLSKPSRDLLELRKTEFFRIKKVKHFKHFNEYWLLSVDFPVMLLDVHSNTGRRAGLAPLAVCRAPGHPGMVQITVQHCAPPTMWK